MKEKIKVVITINWKGKQNNKLKLKRLKKK